MPSPAAVPRARSGPRRPVIGSFSFSALAESAFPESRDQPSRQRSKHLLWLFISLHYQALRECHVAPQNKTEKKKKKSWWGGAVGRTRGDPGRGSAGLIFRSSFLDVASLPEVRLPPSHSSDPLRTLGLVGKTARQPLAVSVVGASGLHVQPLPSPSPGTSWGASRGRRLAPHPLPLCSQRFSEGALGNMWGFM